MRILVFGGSFNPVHLGHLILAEELREEFSYDLVLFVPSARPPHKAIASEPGPEERLRMIELAIEGNPAFAVDPCELARPGLSYTIDTLGQVLDLPGIEGKPGLVLGDDLVAGFSGWRDPEGISRIADIIVARRDGSHVDLAYPHRRASNRLIPLSSSEVRERLASGRSVRYLLPESVRRHIEERRLYGAS